MAADAKLPSMWAERQWKVFLDSEEAIEAAIRYVEENPVKEGKPPQKDKEKPPYKIDSRLWKSRFCVFFS
jgi:hypothetical protein